MRIWDEVRRLPEWLDGAAPKVNLFLFLVIVGVALPWAMGFGYLDPVVLLAVSLVSVVFVAAAAGNAGQEAFGAEIPPRIVAIALGGTAYAMLALAVGIIMFNMRISYGELVLPEAITLASLPLLPLGLSAFLGAEGVRLVRSGRRPVDVGARFRWTVLLLIVVWYLRSSWMPTVVLEAVESRLLSPQIALATVVSGLVFAALAAFRVHQLRRAPMLE